jgi:cell division protein ZapA (FtsZ GTPase activity inhibitor)
MAVGLIVGIMVIMELEREAERIKGEVTAIQRQAEGIRDKIQNPLSTLGETLGARLEDRLSELVRGGSEDE